MEILIAPFGGSLYTQSIALRTSILRKPLNLVYTPYQLDEEKNQIHIVAEEEGEVLAVVLLQKIDNKTAKMRQLAVKDKYQNQGIGTELIAYFEDYALEHGFTNIELHAREKAVRFFKQSQYERVGNVFKEVTLNHYKMVKNLDE
jgi:N-acetylglutamate synthase-like GNAT family acetyltransferase